MKTGEQVQSGHRRRITVAMDFIQANLHRNPPLEEVAQAACFSPFHFHRIFKLLVGETVADFTRRIRLEKAAGLFFYHRDISVTEVAVQLGFSSSQNLAKAFKQYFHLTPSQVRGLTGRDELQALLQQQRKNGNIPRKTGNAPAAAMPYAADQFADSIEGAEMNITIDQFDARQVIYKRLIGVYGAGIQDAFTELHTFVRARDIPTADPVYLIWDNPEITPPEKCRADACITLAGDSKDVAPYTTQTIAAGKYAWLRTMVRAEHEFSAAWDQLFQQILEQGYQPEDRPVFKILHRESSDPQQGVFDVSFCAAVKPR
ncbi:MAG: AraC family transcriptional regulator [Gammaproteobacteria bacterium]|nr:AraC family transcriptional regulator [Gammaproteobacteria bacterium]